MPKERKGKKRKIKFDVGYFVRGNPKRLVTEDENGELFENDMYLDRTAVVKAGIMRVLADS